MTTSDSEIRGIITRIEAYYDPSGVDRAAVKRGDVTAANADELAAAAVAELATVFPDDADLPSAAEYAAYYRYLLGVPAGQEG